MNPQDFRILILGADGYLGWALYQYFSSKGYLVRGLDDFSRRRLVKMAGSDSLFPKGMADTLDSVCIGSGEYLKAIISGFNPTTIVHFAEQPSAPWSMRDLKACSETQTKNIASTLEVLWCMKEICPDAHLIKLGTMGEYGDWIYDGVPIPESNRIPICIYEPGKHDLPDDQSFSDIIDIPTPRYTGSFYHWSKVFDSQNIDFACRIWGLRATDLNQGVVYGTRYPGMDVENRTRFDYDSYFGTVVNRFIVQAIADIPLTVYGVGGQTRGFIHISDVLRAIELVMNNPPESSEFRVVNQLTEVFSIVEIAAMVAKITKCDFASVSNPRKEKEEHTYLPVHERLKNWGLTDYTKMEDAIPEMVEDVEKYKDRIVKEVIMPETTWER
jgi:UDP-sulfoquinovose synthase